MADSAKGFESGGKMGSEAQDPTLGHEPTGAKRTYDVFLSYSHRDKRFAERLEKALTDYRPPLFAGLRPRRLKVFRDQSEADNIRLSDTIAAALRGARKLVVLCSPSSRDRPWVNEEVRRFSKAKGIDNIMPILIAGRPNGEAEAADLPAEAAFPPALIEVLETEPWAPDFRQINASGSKITSDRIAWYHLLATIYGVSRQAIEQRERVRTLTRSAVATLMLAGVGAVIYAFGHERAQKDSIDFAQQSSRQQEPEDKLRLAMAAVVRSSTPQAVDALKTALEPEPAWKFDQSTLVSVDATGKRIAMASPYGTTVVWSPETTERHRVCGHFKPVQFAQISPDGKFLLTLSEGKHRQEGLGLRMQIWDIENNRVLTQVELPGTAEVVKSGFAQDSSALYFTSSTKGGSIWRLPAGTKIADLDRDVEALTFHPDGKSAFLYPESSDRKKPIRMLSMTDGKEVFRTQDIEKFQLLRVVDSGQQLMFLHRSPRKPSQEVVSVNPTLGAEPVLFSTIDLRAVKPLDTLRAHEALDFDYSVLMQSQPRPADELRFTLVDLLSKRNPQIAGEYGFNFMAVASSGNAGVTWNDSAAIAFDLERFLMLAQLERLGEGRFDNLVVSPDGMLVAGLVGDRWTLWASNTGRVQWSEAASGLNHDPRFSADSGRLFLALDDDILVIDTGNLKPIARLQHPNREIAGYGASSSDLFSLLYVDPAGKHAVVRQQHAVYVWDVEAGTSQHLDDVYSADKTQYQTDVAQLEDPSVSVATLMSTARRKLNECPAK